MYKLITTTQFRKDLKRIKKRGLNLQKLQEVLTQLINNQSLDPKHRDHALTGNYIGFRECHIEPDWLLIYAVDKGQLVLVASRTGSHSDFILSHSSEWLFFAQKNRLPEGVPSVQRWFWLFNYSCPLTSGVATSSPNHFWLICWKMPS